MAATREKLVKQAEKLVSRGRVDAAIKQYRKVLSENPRDTNTLNRVGDLYARIEKYEAAVKLFSQIAEQYTDEGFFVKAIAIYKKIIKLDPTRLEVYERLAELYHRQGLVNEARTQYQVLADYHTKHHNSASAISIYQRMVSLEPEDPAHHAKLADLYLQQSLTDKALAEYSTIADIMLGHGHGEEAVQVLERALELDASDLGFIEEFLGKLRDEGQIGGAARFLTLAIERNPEAEALLDLSSAQEALAKEPEVAEPEDAPAPPSSPEDTAEMDPLAQEDAPESAAESEALPPVEAVEIDEDLAQAAAEQESEQDRQRDGEVDLSEDLVLEWDQGSQPESLVPPPPDMLGPGTGFTRTEIPIMGGDPDPSGPDGGGDGSGKVSYDSQEVDLSILELEDLSDETGLDATGEGLEDLQTLGEPDDIELEIDLLDDLDDLDLSSMLEPVDEGLEAGGEVGAEAQGDAASASAPASGSSTEEVPEVAEEDLISEAEVLAKYGLLDKAEERVAELLAENPEQPAALRLRLQLHLERGEDSLALDLGETLARLAGDSELAAAEWHQGRDALIEAGLAVAADPLQEDPVEAPVEAPPERRDEVPDSSQAGAQEKPREETLVVAPEEAIQDEVAAKGPAQDLHEAAVEIPEEAPVEAASLEGEDVPPTGDGPDPSLDALLEEPPDDSPQEPAQEPPPPPSTPLSRDQKARIDRFLDSLLEDARTPGQKRRRASRAVDHLLEKPTEDGAQTEGPTSGAMATLDELTRRYRRPEPPPPEAQAPVAEGAAEDAFLEDVAPRAEAPATPAIDLEDHTDIEDAVAALGPQEVASAEAADLTDPHLADVAEVDDTGVSWLDDVASDEQRDREAEEVFEDEEGFFDLAAELEEELSVSEATGLAEPSGEQTLEQIVEGFKKGVSEVLPEDDYATHRDLGIAYQEMGLVDEAIGEFQQAAKEPALLVECCSMLGQCFRDKGLPELALKWYTRGLAAPELSEEDGLALLYELGDVYLGSGDRQNARKTFVEVYGVDSNYRDVVAKLAELE